MGLLSLVLTVVGAVPTVYFFFNDQVAGGILTGVIAFLIVIGVLVARWYLALPDYTLIEVDKSLTLNDRFGHSATQVSEMKARANGPGLRHFDFRVWGTDGTVGNFMVNDGAPSRVHTVAGATVVVEEFSVPLKRFEKKDIKVAFDCTDTFPDADEDWTHAVAYHTKKMRLRVRFPPGRPCISARASLRYGGRPHGPLGGLTRTDNGRELRLEVNKPELGAQYTIEWSW